MAREKYCIMTYQPISPKGESGFVYVWRPYKNLGLLSAKEVIETLKDTLKRDVGYPLISHKIASPITDSYIDYAGMDLTGMQKLSSDSSATAKSKQSSDSRVRMTGVSIRVFKQLDDGGAGSLSQDLGLYDSRWTPELNENYNNSLYHRVLKNLIYDQIQRAKEAKDGDRID